MSDLRELYQEVILDHAKKPRNFHTMPDSAHAADGHNPLCGDRLRVFVRVENGVIEDVSFTGSGCAISTASASMMTEALNGKSLADAQAIFESFHNLLTTGNHADKDEELLGKLAVFGGVREFPVRVKCATLAWHTLQAALQGSAAPVKTE
ncbi:MAG: SUF system NifU family Fe-S cluster assembly protein [Phycisphaerae bacterium]|nr:SUF system NifU family Fe-S cluster assembly protein [Phycisphaerae bacterium]